MCCSVASSPCRPKVDYGKGALDAASIIFTLALAKTSYGGGLVDEWWPRAESNHRHKDFQSSALPTELLGQAPNYNPNEPKPLVYALTFTNPSQAPIVLGSPSDFKDTKRGLQGRISYFSMS